MGELSVDEYTRHRSAKNELTWRKHAAFTIRTTISWKRGLVENVRFLVWPVGAPDRAVEFNKRRDCENWMEVQTGYRCVQPIT
jgi:hypothetical protein